ncbi:MAG: PLP-dependent aminotransferase family protein [Ardenticatenaceae bacterium]|nr:PLP-dependent aminotransferase family protein [Ardenticatenaceae bacterium]
MTTPWEHRYAQRMRWMGSSAIRELLKLTTQTDIISFAGGLPAPEVFPVEAFAEASQRVLVEHGSDALQYSTTDGYRPLREWIVEKMAQYRIEAAPENVLITSGSQQALDLIGKVLINAGDRILTEKPTYLGALQAWQAYQAEYVTVPIDDDGLRTGEHLERAITTGPKFMYVLPNFQNPGGVTLPLGRRWEIIAIAERYGIPIIEDDPYGELRYEGEHIPPLVVLDATKLDGVNGNNARNLLNGNVIYLSTFSKTLAPGLRLGWIVAPASVIEKCVIAKQGMDLHTSSFVQMVAYEVVKDGFLKEHVRHIRQVYKARRDVMLAAMSHFFPPEVSWTRPQGGLFLWVTLPEWMDSADLFNRAIKHKVAFVPGASFYPDGSGHNTMRLNFSNAQPEQIEVGIERLGRAIKAELAAFKKDLVVAQS